MPITTPNGVEQNFRWVIFNPFGVVGFAAYHIPPMKSGATDIEPFGFLVNIMVFIFIFDF